MRHSKLALVALVAACSGLAVSGCSGENKPEASNLQGNYGEVQMNLSIDGENIDTLVYSIALASAPDAEVAGGTADVSADGATATASAQLAPGDYVVTLTTPDDDTCLGSGTFTITPSGATTVAISMTCGSAAGAPETGSVEIELTDITRLSSCGITESFAAPLTTSGNITLNAEATAGATFEWSVAPAAAGTFVDATAAATTFNCDAETAAAITLTITDGACNDSHTYNVSCLGEVLDPCGNGVIDDGENCGSCLEDVLAVEGPDACDVCGDGVLGGSESCDNCEADVLATGGSCGPVCGNGVVEAGEDCDTCEADLIAVDPAACTPAGPSDAACNTCISAGNPDIAGFNEGVCNGDPLCVATRACVVETGCFGGDNRSHLCYCGEGVSVADCIAPSFVPAGVCAAEMVAGLGDDSPSNQTRLERQFNPAFGAGAAFAILTGSRDVGQCVPVLECNL